MPRYNVTGSVVVSHDGRYYVWGGEGFRDALVEMWNEGGMSSCQLGRYWGVTRSQVLGVIHREKAKDVNRVKSRESTHRTYASPKEKQLRTVVQVKEVPEEVDALVLESGGHITLENVNDNTCRWPIGDPLNVDFHFCGHAPENGPYCATHRAKAHVTMKPYRLQDYRPRYR